MDFNIDKEQKAKNIFLQAESFHQAAVILNRESIIKMREPSTQLIGAQLIITSIVNHSFSFELYLKCFSFLENGEFIYTHNLIELFDQISSINQEKIIKEHESMICGTLISLAIESYGRSKDFKDLLGEAANTFKELRYSFDNSKEMYYDLDYAISSVRKVLIESYSFIL